jgi:hypothetical protein
MGTPLDPPSNLSIQMLSFRGIHGDVTRESVEERHVLLRFGRRLPEVAPDVNVFE